MKNYDMEKYDSKSYQLIQVDGKYRVALSEEFDSEESARRFAQEQKITLDDKPLDDDRQIDGNEDPFALTDQSKKTHNKMLGAMKTKPGIVIELR